MCSTSHDYRRKERLKFLRRTTLGTLMSAALLVAVAFHGRHIASATTYEDDAQFSALGENGYGSFGENPLRPLSSDGAEAAGPHIVQVSPSLAFEQQSVPIHVSVNADGVSPSSGMYALPEVSVEGTPYVTVPPDAIVEPPQAVMSRLPAHIQRISISAGLSSPNCGVWEDIAAANGRKWDADVVVLLIERESSCDPTAVSKTGDWGLLQINSACWAGTELGGLEDVDKLPSNVRRVGIQCDGRSGRPLEAQWCYRAKEAYFDTGNLPESPCDAWLDPATNLEVAYRLWEEYDWRPWCFNKASKSSNACKMAYS